MGVVAAAPRTAAGRVPALGGAAIVSAGVAAACGRRALELAVGVATAGPDELVELAVLATGALVLAWLAASAAMAVACLLARHAGGAWRHGEAWVQRCAPAAVRRALVVAVAAGLGAASVTSASAADLSTTAGPSTASVATGDAGPDLGWAVTTTVPAPSLPPAGSAAASQAPAAALPGTTSAAPAPSAAMAGTTSAAPAPAVVTTAPFDPGWAPSVGSAMSGATARGGGSSLGTSGTLTPGAWRPTVSPGSNADALAVPGAARWTSGDGAPAGGEAATVVVVRGDTLWGIAARHLPADASEADVAAAWPAWYAANAATIGPDPGLILPGQVLVAPPAMTR
ncbi:MAG: hypothetical protein BGO37_03555 [Cellulomonas sp. 73-92]|uniref:LysM peptidoglycan-binding domain-containing protein n=1 Tax=Cellulomonas sp. 73-92 TaxID=1895740 RepID=UPI000927F256|nr:LysM domain-containing protein [Cellulomonas sp. 73-92]OJV82093.1 MAG: hypothetical protein BGO37_03555 [Cellulomonas sp. 73-92]